MIDITDKIKAAIEQNVLWSVSDFYCVLEELAKTSFQTHFWYNENYMAVITDNDHQIGYIWQKYPLIFSLTTHINTIQDALKDYPYIIYIETNNLNDEIYQADYQQLQPRVDGSMNFNKFSANEFWFYNVN